MLKVLAMLFIGIHGIVVRSTIIFDYMIFDEVRSKDSAVFCCISPRDRVNRVEAN